MAKFRQIWSHWARGKSEILLKEESEKRNRDSRLEVKKSLLCDDGERKEELGHFAKKEIEYRTTKSSSYLPFSIHKIYFETRLKLFAKKFQSAKKIN